MLKHVSRGPACCNSTCWPNGSWVPPSASGARRGRWGPAKGVEMEEREARSEKVISADPIIVSHLLTVLRAREDLTRAEPSSRYQMNQHWVVLVRANVFFL